MAMRKPGPYAPLSAHYADDEKVMAVGEDAELLYVRMLAYAARTPMTEGWISDAVVQSRLGILPRQSGSDAGIEPGIEPGTDAGSRAEKLREVGLIEREGSGYRIASWLKWNRSIEEMGRERARDQQRKSGSTSENDGSDAGNDAGTGTGVVQAFPLSDTDQNQINTSNAQSATFDEFWDLYPRKRDKDKAKTAYQRAVKRAGGSEPILEGLRRHLPGWQRKEQKYVPYPTTWLNGGRWQDEIDDDQDAGSGGSDEVPFYWQNAGLA